MSTAIAVGRFAVICLATAAAGRADPTITRADIVYQGGPATVASVGRTPSGALLVAYNTRGDLLPRAEVRFVRSNDGGLHWRSQRFRIVTGRDDMGVNITATSLWTVPGTNKMVMFPLLATWAKPVNETSFGTRKLSAHVWRSDDDGRTFSPLTTEGRASTEAGFFQGNVVDLGDGVALAPWGNWGGSPRHGFRRSEDGGESWGPFLHSWQDPPPGQEKALAFNETAVALCPNGAIVAIARVDTLVDKRFWLITSNDRAATFSAPKQIEPAGGSPALLCRPNGQLWLAYRDAGLGPGVGLSVSDDQGETWRFVTHLREPTGEHERIFGSVRYTDEDRAERWRPHEGIAGYPFFQPLDDARVYVVFHARRVALVLRSLVTGADPFFLAGNVLTDVP